MAGGYKIRLGDGSEIGPMDLQAVRTWYSQGLIDEDSPVLKPGAKSWSTLGEVKELAAVVGGGARPKAKGGRGSRSAARADGSGLSGGEDRYEYSDWSERWRTLVAGLVFLVGAGAAGFLAYAPQHALPEFDGAPWLQIALAQVAFALALLPGWDLGRKLVRGAAFLVAIAIFPLTGIFVAQGVRGPALIVLASAWVLASGLFAFLGASMGLPKAVLWLVAVLAGAAGIGRFGLAPENEQRKQVREWATPERRFADETLGLVLDLPEGWVILKRDNPLVAAEATLSLAHPRASAFAYFVSESSPSGVGSLDRYLDRVLADRSKAIPSLREMGRADVTVGRLAGRKAAGSWQAGGVAYRDVTTVWKDGWVYFALVAWLPEAAPARAAQELDALLEGFSTSGTLAARLQDAVEVVTEEVPQLTAPAAEILMGQSAAQVLEPDQAFRRSLEAVARALPTWSEEETRDMSDLLAATYAALPWKDRRRLAGYIEKVRAGQLTPPSEDREMAELMKGAVLRLPPLKRVRLQALYEKAVRATVSPS